jgi:hypothetical protein
MNRRIRNIMAVSSFAVLAVSTNALARQTNGINTCKQCVGTCGSGLIDACHKCGMSYIADGCYLETEQCSADRYQVKCKDSEPQ